MQKTKKFRRLLAGGVAVLMLGVSVPVAAFATDTATPQNATEPAPAKNLTFTFQDADNNSQKYVMDDIKNSFTVPSAEEALGYDVEGDYYWYCDSYADMGTLEPGQDVTAEQYAAWDAEYITYTLKVVEEPAPAKNLTFAFQDENGAFKNYVMDDIKDGFTVPTAQEALGYDVEGDYYWYCDSYADMGTLYPGDVVTAEQYAAWDAEYITYNLKVVEEPAPAKNLTFTFQDADNNSQNYVMDDIKGGFTVPTAQEALGYDVEGEYYWYCDSYADMGTLKPGDYVTAEQYAAWDAEYITYNLKVVEEPAPETVTMNIQFKDGDEVVAGGDYTVPAGVQNYAVLEQYVPEGYEIAEFGDFWAEDGGKLKVRVEKIVNTVIMGIRFVTRDGEFVAGGDYFLPEGVQNYSILEQYLSEGYKLADTGDFMVEEGGQLDVVVEKISTDVMMKIRFVTRDGEFVSGGDYFLPEGVQNLSILEDIVPEGYQMTETGDFMVEEGGSRDVTVEKVGETTDVIMNIRFVTRDGEFVAGGDYFLPEGVQNYSILEDLVPEGYQMTVSGDFMVEAGTSLDVTIEKISTDVIMNIRFVTRDGEFVAGGDYFLPEGVQNLSILEDLVPTGYRMTETGDFMVEAGTSRDVTIELIPTEVIMNIQFWDNDSGEVVAGGDYFVPMDEDGIQNYSILQQYVPEGYEMLTSGDFFVVEGGHLDVTVQKIQRDVIMNIRFVLADGTFIAGGDYFLPEGIQNMSILEQYVPAGYKMMESGDFFVTEGGQEDITVEKINETVTVSVAFKNEWGFVVGGGYYIVPAGEQDVSVLAQYVPAGYVLDEEGTINFVDGQHYDISVKSDESIVNIQFIDREGNVIAGGDYFVPTGVQNTAILDELGYTPVGYRQVVHTYVLFMYGHHYVILVEAIPEQVTAKTAVFRKDAAEDVWNENPDNPDEVRYTFYSDDAEATNTVPSITVADETKELDYWVAEMDSSITLQPGEEFCYNDLDQGALKDQIGDLLFIAVYKDVEVVEPTPAPSEEPTPAPSEEPTPAPSEQPTAEPTAAPTAQPETPADNNDDNTTTVTSDNSDDVVKSDTPADNTAKVLPQTGVESSAPVIGFAFVLLAALGGAAAYLFVVRKKLN